MRRVFSLAVLTGAILALGASGASAQSKSFFMRRAQVDVQVDVSGAVDVREELTYSFSGPFSGGYRDIKVADGQEITDISVSEGGTQYTPGASAELGSSGTPGTFGVARVDDHVRVVWHYSAQDEDRTFTIA